MGSSNQFLYVFLIPIIIFWLFIPIPFMLFGIGGANSNLFESTSQIKNDEKPNVITYITFTITQLGFYLKMVFLWIDGLPLIFNLILTVFRLISWLIVILAIRG